MGFLFSKKEDKIEEKVLKERKYTVDEFQELIKSINLVEQINKNRIFYKDINSKSLDNFSNKYSNFVNIKRFCIPIIGAISCGKSTFMNYLMPSHNLLEIGENVTTKFICIIRHKKDCKNPEVYNTKIEERDENNGFNFIEDGEDLLKSNNLTLSDIIKNKNKEIKNKENSNEYKMNPENYFLIIKMNIPIFDDKEYSKYGELIDFIDIPGLDEVNELEPINNFEDFILPIFKNILFPFLIFDVKTYFEPKPKNILFQYLDYYFKVQRDNQKNKSYNKGFFILNKIDCLGKDSKEEKIIDDFKNIYKEVERYQWKITIPFKELSNNNENNNNIKNEFIAISAKNLLKEQNYSYSYSFIEKIIKEAKKSELSSFRTFISDFIYDNYNKELDDIKIPENKITDEIKEELNNINNNLKKEIKLEDPEFLINEYVFLKENNLNDTQCKNNEKIKKIIQERIKLLIDNFLNFEYEDLKNALEKSNKMKMKLKIKEFEPSFIDDFIEKVDSLIPCCEMEKYKKLKEIKEIINEFKRYKKNKKIRLLFIGKISSGKTSLLNSIIGNNLKILESTMLECTKSNFIIKNANDINNISLYENILIKNKYGDYFKEKQKQKQEFKFSDIEDLKNKIKLFNKDENLDKYYTLEVPIEAFNNKEYKDEIEIIDIPGIREDKINELNIEHLVKLCDGFIFTFKDIILDNESSIKIFTSIMEYIKQKKCSFDFKNCLFNLNYIDETDNNEIKEKIENFEKNIKALIINKIYKGNFKERLNAKKKIKSINNLKISYFSNIYYSQYQTSISKIKKLEFPNRYLNNFERLYKYLLTEYKEIKINENIDTERTDEKVKEILKLKENCSDGDKSFILNISKLLISIEDNKHQLKKYKESYADIFFGKFNEQISFSYLNKNEEIKEKFLSFSFTILFKLYYFNNLCKNTQLIEEYKNNIKNIKKIIENKFKELNNDINSEFYKIENELDYAKNNIIVRYTESKKIEEKEIRKITRELKEKTRHLKDNLDNILKELEKECYQFCIDKITDLINDEDFGDLGETILIYFGEKKGNSSSFLLYRRLFKPLTFFNYIYNKIKISEISDVFRKQFINYRIEYLEMIKNKKNEFILELEIIENISVEEIEYLKKKEFVNKFSSFVIYLKEKLKENNNL